MKTAYDFIEFPGRIFQQMNWPSKSTVIVLTDEHTAKLCYPVISAFLPDNHINIVIPADENSKNPDTCNSVWKQMLEAKEIDRNSILINCGGGLVSDLGGFAASVFKRGIRFYNVPTTLLSMVDAAFGGKTGVNFLQFKNQIGTFYHPSAVFLYTGFLKTLDQLQILSGFGEILKYALISDQNFWDELKMITPSLINLKPDFLKKCIDFKLQVVEEDELDLGKRKILNFGHTIGHALESLNMKHASQILPHGVAVAHGILMESMISNKLKLLDSSYLIEIENYILKNFGKISLNESDIPTLIHLMKADKKNADNEIAFAFIDKPGNCLINIAVNENIITDSLLNYISK